MSRIPSDTGPSIATTPASARSEAATVRRRRALSVQRRTLSHTWHSYVETSNNNTWRTSLSLSLQLRLSVQRVCGYDSADHECYVVTPLIVILIMLGLFAINPTTTNPIYHFLFISYPVSGEPPRPYPTEPSIYHNNPQLYGKGLYDIAFCVFYTIVFSFAREFVMQVLLKPLARRWGIKEGKKMSRFLEQAYTFCYFSISGTFGLIVMSRTDMWFFNTPAFWQAYPHRALPLDFKFYYLLQASYWLQQALVLLLQLEAPRKDFKELVLHHIITLLLIGLSYRFHFTATGVAVFITMDVSDVFLALSKCLNYLDHPLGTPCFGFFILVWFYCRHYLSAQILISCLTTYNNPPYTPFPEPIDWLNQQYKCWIAKPITVGLLGALLGVNIFWSWLILRIAGRFVWKGEAKDERSDDEEEEEKKKGE
ncbi:longevity assurance proteins LAG1/LAC1 [Saitoella complicata NRRL Y-17804]|uniref:longevity assurance proteins LAG1/LAC1 n=1 Tax=Saitoella complicata (strain BCRC 22490 / CBS 7301 / JCM 7358 / NBRC 10748 / NRRL Y-17804) TaxID=698492 RepID=UPI000866BEBE|nr:longevity assurance proteins LAG1/LAC1 [Saitoella complicata NRRL Y-17804]ODQ49773.1 longevity assurance proteins LAG1/LAC1 [Saitoella complicata NRRL Y-17804]